MRLCVIDFETKDPYIGLGLGGGWCYAMASDTSGFEVLGAAVRLDTGETEYITDMAKLEEVIKPYDGLIMHNAMYDYGILMYLYPKLMKDKNFFIYDSKIMAKVLHPNLYMHSLKAMASLYDVAKKCDDKLFDSFFELGIYSKVKSEKTGKKFTARPGVAELKNTTYANLDLLPVEVVGEYAIADVVATFEIFEKMRGKYDAMKGMINKDTIDKVLKITIDMRARGLRVDIEKAEQARKLLEHKYETAAISLYHTTGKFNVNSAAECAAVLQAAGMKLPTTAHGNISVTKGWLEKQEHAMCKDILRVRKYDKIKRDFIDKVLAINEMSGNAGKFGRIYSELQLFGASTTGRFSSNSINIQQIPSGDPELGSMIRSIFLPEEGEKWASCDFSGQETRMQVHYAAALKCDGAAQLVKDWCASPNLDFHQKVADMLKWEGKDGRKRAKAINFGLSYGMGPGTMCQRLGYPTTTKSFVNEEGQCIEYEKPGMKGKAILESYHDMFPFLKSMKATCEQQMRVAGYIKTIGGRKLKPKAKYDHRNGLNWLIQGGSADQTILSMIAAADKGLHILSVIHDEINISYKNDDDLIKLQEAMENSLSLSVPTVTDMTTGSSWGDAK